MIIKKKIEGTLLVAIGILKSYTNFHRNCTEISRVMSKWAYVANYTVLSK